MKTLKLIVAATTVAALMTTAASAAPLLGGAMSKIGCFVPVNGATGAATTLPLATGLDFGAVFGCGPSPDPGGVAGQMLITTSSGDFAAFATPGSIGSIYDFTFQGPGSASYPSVPFSPFETIGGLTFGLTGIVSVTHGGSDLVPSVEIVANGVFTAAGFDATPGTVTLDATSTGTTFSWNASQIAVPEPASLTLLGTSLIGLGWAGRRRLAKL